MAYVITGATGHLGNNVCRYLLNQGETVRIIIRKDNKSTQDLNCEKIIGNYYEEEVLKKSIFKDDIVLHFAGFIDIKNKYKDECFKVNYEATKSVAMYAYNVGARKFIYSSSSDCIYKDDIDGEIKEQDRMKVECFKDNYPLSKALATNFLLDFKKDHDDFNLAIIYPTSIYGINDYKPSSIGKVFLDVINGKSEYAIKGHYNFVYVEDICFAIKKIVDLDKEGNYIISGETRNVEELYNAINSALNIEKKKLRIPKFLVYLAIPFVPYLSKFVFKTITGNTNFSHEKATNELGYVITPFEEGIKKTINWFQNEKRC